MIIIIVVVIVVVIVVAIITVIIILHMYILYTGLHILAFNIIIRNYKGNCCNQLFYCQANSSTAQCVTGTITTSLHPLLPGQQNTSQSSYSSDVNNKSSWSAIMSRSGDGMYSYEKKYICVI